MEARVIELKRAEKVEKVLKVEMDTKNLLVIKITDYQYFDWAEDIIDHLHKWFTQENTPLFAIAIPDGIEIDLKKIEHV